MDKKNLPNIIVIVFCLFFILLFFNLNNVSFSEDFLPAISFYNISLFIIYWLHLKFKFNELYFNHYSFLYFNLSRFKVAIEELKTIVKNKFLICYNIIVFIYSYRILVFNEKTGAIALFFILFILQFLFIVIFMIMIKTFKKTQFDVLKIIHSTAIVVFCLIPWGFSTHLNNYFPVIYVNYLSPFSGLFFTPFNKLLNSGVYYLGIIPILFFVTYKVIRKNTQEWPV